MYAALGNGAPPSWWSTQSSTMKTGIVLGGLYVAGVAAWMLLRKKPTKSMYASNSKKPKARKGSVQYKMRKAGRKCPAKPPAKYARKGARQRSQYAFPECYGWPIHNRVHVIAAKAKFTRFGGRLPPAIRKQVEGRISKASKRLGLGAYHAR
jgi:hypothetical protein